MAIDDNTLYGLTGAQVKELPGKIEAAKGKAKVLTADDYNYPTDNPTKIAAWLLPDGVYEARGTSVWWSTGSADSNFTFIKGTDSGNSPYVLRFNSAGAYLSLLSNNGSYVDTHEILLDANVKNNLTSTSTTSPLSAAQGKVLKDFIGDLTNLTTTDKTNLVAAINEAAAGGGGSGIIELTSADIDYPDANPTGIALWRLDNGTYYIADASLTGFTNTANESSSTVNQGVYIIGDYGTASKSIVSFDVVNSKYWVFRTNKNTGAKGNATSISPSIVQTTGTSTTDVMSQNATTSMMFADPSTAKKVRIGNTVNMAIATDSIAIGAGVSSIGQYSTAIGPYSQAGGIQSVAIGQGASAERKWSVAIGDNAHATTDGEVAIGSTVATGYNNSNYRLLTGLYDPQSDHDAATKGYVDNSLLGKQDTLTAGTGISISNNVISATGGGGLDPNTTFWGQTASNGAVTGRITFGTNGYVDGTNNTVTVYADTAGGVDPFEFSHTGLDVASKKITNLATPTANGDAATKGYVDTAVAGAGTSAFTTNEWNALWA